MINCILTASEWLTCEDPASLGMARSSFSTRSPASCCSDNSLKALSLKYAWLLSSLYPIPCTRDSLELDQGLQLPILDYLPQIFAHACLILIWWAFFLHIPHFQNIFKGSNTCFSSKMLHASQIGISSFAFAFPLPKKPFPIVAWPTILRHFL